LSLSSDPAGKLHVLGHDGHTLSVDGTKVSVLEKTNEEGLSCLLKGEHRLALEPKVTFELLSDLANEPLEGKLPDEELSLYDGLMSKFLEI
jgi:hypothetical protein